MGCQGRGEHSGVQTDEELQGYSTFITAAKLWRATACGNGKMGRYHMTGGSGVVSISRGQHLANLTES